MFVLYEGKTKTSRSGQSEWLVLVLISIHIKNISIHTNPLGDNFIIPDFNAFLDMKRNLLYIGDIINI